MKTLSVLMPLPHQDFDPTEVAVSWQVLHQAGIDVQFATPDGHRAFADPVMISGEGLDPWGKIPGLKKIKCLGLLLRADRFARSAYKMLERHPAFLTPITYRDIHWDNFDGLLLPGGHAKGMCPYLEDKTLQQKVASFFDNKLANDQHKPIAAVCHGVVLAARSISEVTGKSSLHGLKTTALPWDFERTAWQLCKYFARYWDPHYYRTYLEAAHEPEGYQSVEEEVKRCLAAPGDFLNVPRNSNFYFYKSSGFFRDRIDDERPAWIVQDGNYLSARWPGDVHSFARRFVEMLEATYKR